MKNKKVVRITENELKRIVNESVNKVLNEAKMKPNDAFFGGYFFEGIRFTLRGVPVYYSQHLPLAVKDLLGWRKSKKWGRCGYATDWDVRHALEELGLPLGKDKEEYYNSLNDDDSI